MANRNQNDDISPLSTTFLGVRHRKVASEERVLSFTTGKGQLRTIQKAVTVCRVISLLLNTTKQRHARHRRATDSRLGHRLNLDDMRSQNKKGLDYSKQSTRLQAIAKLDYHSFGYCSSKRPYAEK
jgi:hypothetical protein